MGHRRSLKPIASLEAGFHFWLSMFPPTDETISEVKIMNTELYNENFEVLHKKFYPKWIVQVRSKIPSDYNISDNEIVSEITIRCLELAEKFKGGFFPSYCDLYVVCEVVKRLYKEYKKLDHSLIADAYRDWEEGEDYVQHHQYIEYVDTYVPTSIYDTIDLNDVK